MAKVYPKDLYYIDTAIKLHFKSNSFDAIKYRMKTRSIADDVFEKKKTFNIYVRLAEKLADQNIHPIEFVLANVLAGEGFISYFTVSNHTEWRTRIESIRYNTIKEINSCMADYSIDKFAELFKMNEQSSFPMIVRHYLEKKISLETITVINMFVGFTEKLQINDLGWDEIRQTITKYQPFLKRLINTEKVKLKLLETYR
jgi:hypothetical protein